MFNGIWLVACEPLTLRGREVQPGERFEISRTKSGALLVLGRAMIAESQAPPPKEPDPPAPRRRGRPRKTETAEPVDAVESTETPEMPEAPPRRYRRRDLEAEP